MVDVNMDGGLERWDEEKEGRERYPTGYQATTDWNIAEE